MKKKLLFAMTAVLMLGLTACGEEKEKEDKKDKDEVVESVSDDEVEEGGETTSEETIEETTEETSEEMYSESGAYYIANTIDWGEEKDLTDVTIFCDKITLPITLDELDAACAPYVYSAPHYGEYDEIYENENAQSIFDIYAMPYTFTDSSNEVDISTQVQFDANAEKPRTYYDEEYDCNIEDFIVDDYNCTGMTLTEAFDQGHWYMGTFAGVYDTFVIDDYADDEDLLYKIVEKYGKPSYLYCYNPDNVDVLKNNANGSFIYNIVYEREDYSFNIGVFEMIYDGEYYQTTIQSLEYFPIAQWEEYKIKEGIDEDNIIMID